PPNFCDNSKPPVKKFSNKTLRIIFCIRSYPVLSRDIFVNNVLYRVNSTTNDVMVDSSVDDKTFSNYLILKIPVTDSLKTVNITVKSVKNYTYSFTVHVTENY
ncbi:hypothetical protein Bpfe_026266, partial [Biomphalaria pfeifferi]